MNAVKRFICDEDRSCEYEVSAIMRPDPDGGYMLYSEHQSELAALREDLADMQHWRDLALQFDNHRMTALWHLKTLAVNPSYAPAVSDFLASPPLPASEVVQRLTAAEQRNANQCEIIKAYQDVNAELESGLRIFAVMAAKSTISAVRLIAKQTLNRAHALKPTESGASE